VESADRPPPRASSKWFTGLKQTPRWSLRTSRPLTSRKGNPLRSLVFNLLHDCARQAGCSDQAWEIIAEFAAAEALLDRVCGEGIANDEGSQSRSAAFLTAAEALLACMGHQGIAGDEFDKPTSILPGSN